MLATAGTEAGGGLRAPASPGCNLAVVLGAGASLWRDIDLLGPMLERRRFTVLAVNEAGIHYPARIDHWVTLHPEKLPGWRAKRNGNFNYETWAHANHRAEATDHQLNENWNGEGSGSSGLFAVRVALYLGCDRIVLCGVPMDRGPHFTDSLPWLERDAFWRAWMVNADFLRGFVRSMSGETAKLLGSPTNTWLEGKPE